jgi:hypothetical protein
VAADSRGHGKGAKRGNSALECVTPLETFLQTVTDKLELEPGKRTAIRDISHFLLPPPGLIIVRAGDHRQPSLRRFPMQPTRIVHPVRSEKSEPIGRPGSTQGGPSLARRPETRFGFCLGPAVMEGYRNRSIAFRVRWTVSHGLVTVNDLNEDVTAVSGPSTLVQSHCGLSRGMSQLSIS